LTNADIHTISTVGLISCCMSTIGSSMVIIAFILFPSLRTFRGRLVFFLCVANFIWMLSLIIGLSSFFKGSVNETLEINLPFCEFLGFLVQWFEIIDGFWVCSIAVYLYLSIVKRKNLKEYEWLFHVLSWGVPFILSLIPWFIPGGYGIAGSWCWIHSTENQLLFGYLIVWIDMSIILTLYSLIILHIIRIYKSIEVSEETKFSTKKALKKLICYPLIFVVQWTPGTINRIQNAVDPSNPLVVLYCFHIFFVCSTGFLNFIFYTGFNKKILQNAYLSKFFERFASKIEPESSTIGGSKDEGL